MELVFTVVVKEVIIDDYLVSCRWHQGAKHSGWLITRWREKGRMRIPSMGEVYVYCEIGEFHWLPLTEYCHTPAYDCISEEKLIPVLKEKW